MVSTVAHRTLVTLSLCAIGLAALVGVEVGVVATLAGHGPTPVSAVPVAASTGYSLWAPTAPRRGPASRADLTVLGTQFRLTREGRITALQFYKVATSRGPFVGRLYTARGRLLASVRFRGTTSVGWHRAPLTTPVRVHAGHSYVAAYVAPHGRYAADWNGFAATSRTTQGPLTAVAGRYSFTRGFPRRTHPTNHFADVVFRSLASTSGSSASSGAFPGPSNTGVPAGTSLTSYTGPMTITSPTTINAKQINGTLVVKAPLTITNSKINGNVDSDYGSTVSITDSEIDGGTSQAPAVGYSGVTLLRVNIHGSRQSVNCGSNCSVTDSWLHGQYLQPGSDWHVNGYISNGGSNVVIRHNTIACDTPDDSNGGGCTGPAASFGDFAPIKNTTYDHNLFKAGPGGYCLYAGYDPNKAYGSNPSNVSVTNNVFEHGSSGQCGWYRPASAYLAGNGDVWSGNTWDDGTVVNAP